MEFVINTNMCILNGRNHSKNDFTSVSVKDSSVVVTKPCRHPVILRLYAPLTLLAVHIMLAV